MDDIRLDHINIPSLRPDWLAEWYAEHFGFRARDGFVVGAGILLVFEAGKPADYGVNTHFGFRCSSRERVVAYAEKFEVALDDQENFCGFQAQDPEGNVFEVYWEDV
jgi:hypothetical protein